MVKKKLNKDKKNGECAICDSEMDLEYYTKKASSEEVAAVLALIKICVSHARQIDDANMKRDIERTVA